MFQWCHIKTSNFHGRVPGLRGGHIYRQVESIFTYENRDSQAPLHFNPITTPPPFTKYLKNMEAKSVF